MQRNGQQVAEQANSSTDAGEPFLREPVERRDQSFYASFTLGQVGAFVSKDSDLPLIGESLEGLAQVLDRSALILRDAAALTTAFPPRLCSASSLG